MGNVKVCCLIITYAPTRETLDACVESLLSQTRKPDRIILADNRSSGSGIVDTFERPTVEKLMFDSNHGFSGAINRGLEKIDEEFVLVMNFDIILEPGFIEEALKGFKELGILCVTGKTLFIGDRSVIDNTGTLVNGLMSAYNRGVGQIDIGQYDKPDNPMGACFAAALIRRAAFDRNVIGPMDEKFFLYYEDVDWCYRLNIYGFKSAYVPGAVAYHHHSLTTRDKGLMFKYYYIQRNLLFTIVKNMRFRTVLKLLAKHFIYHTRRARIETKFWPTTIRIYIALLLSIPRLVWQRVGIQRRRKVSDTDVIDLAIGERAHLDDIHLTAQVSWENLADSYARLATISDDDLAKDQANILSAAGETDEIHPDVVQQVRRLFESADERVRRMLDVLLSVGKGDID